MPVIVYKTMNIRARWAQIRRIQCAECPATFVYVASAMTGAATMGVPLVSSDDSMRERVRRSLQKTLDRIEHGREIGTARCAACRHAQPWMLRSWFRQHVDGVSVALLILLPFAVVAGFAYGDSMRGRPFSWGAFLFLLVLVLGAVFLFGWVRVRMHLGSEETPNGRSMRDAEFRDFLADCTARDLDPALTWWFARVERKNPPSDVALISLPFADLAGGFEPPGPVPPPVPPSAAPRR